LLLARATKVVKQLDGNLVEFPLYENVVHQTPNGVAYILVAFEDSFLYEWWQDPFIADPCPGVFDTYKKSRVGP
jgi:hypothetical protein